MGEIFKDIVEDDKRAGEVIRRLRQLLAKGTPLRALDLNEALEDVAQLVSGDAWCAVSRSGSSLLLGSRK